MVLSHSESIRPRNSPAHNPPKTTTCRFYKSFFCTDYILGNSPPCRELDGKIYATLITVR